MTSRRSRLVTGAALLALGAAATPALLGGGAAEQATSANPTATDGTITLTPLGSYATGLGAESAETAAVSLGRLYVTNSAANSLDVVDVADPAAPNRLRRIDLSPWGSGPTSVDARGGLVAVAMKSEPETAPGRVVFLNRAGDLVDVVPVGSLPDMLRFADEGRRVLVANEGQPSSYGQATSVDPEGSVSVIEVERLGRTPAHKNLVSTASFAAFNVGGPRHRELPAGIRLNGPGATVAQDLEPEYIAVSKDGRTAHVTLQEANAIATIDVRKARVTRIDALGTKDHSAAGNGLDASDRDNMVNIATWPIKGLFMPDAVSAFTVGGKGYLITANEGDARDYTGFADEARLGSSTVTLDPAVFPNAASLKQNANLGRLNISTTDGKGPNGYREIHSFGSRSATIWTADGARVWDSGDLFERVTAKAVPGAFNASNDDNAFDSRSDNKGPEPEGVATGTISGRTYAFVGLERIGGIMVLDVSDPRAPSFVQWANNRDFARTPTGPDSGPEVVKFVPAKWSPSRRPLVMVANEISGTVTFYEARPRTEATTLSLLHNNDGESSLLPIAYTTPSGRLDVGSASAFKAVTDREITHARARRHSVVNVYAGDALLASSTLACSLPPQPAGTPIYDAVAQRQIAYDAHIFGNHEFDFGPDFLKSFVTTHRVNGRLDQPFLSANLDFAAEPDWAGLLDADGVIVGEARDGRVVGRSLIHTDPTTGQRFGVVGATTWLLPTISSPRGVTVTADIDATARVVQQEVDRLANQHGLKKILFVSHLQDVSNDRALVAKLRGIDVAVAGGGDELLANGTAGLLPGEAQAIQGTYPTNATDLDGRTVPIVTTAGNYKYLGRLGIRFDDAGHVAEVLSDSGPRRVIPNVQPTAGILATLGVTDAVRPDAGIEASVTTPVKACLAAYAQPIAGTQVALDTARASVRSRESNAGNLIADGFLNSYDRYGAAFGLPARSGAKVIAVQNGGGIRQPPDVLPVGGTVPGAITRQNTLDVLAFLTNTMTVVRNVTPADLKAIFERSAATLPGQGGQFLQVAGVRVRYSLAGTAQVLTTTGAVTTPGSRVVSVTLDDGTRIVDGGAVVAGAPNVALVTNSFTAGGGDNYPWLRENPAKVNLPATYEQALVEFLGTFPAATIGTQSLPTVPISIPGYATASPGVRITIAP